MGDGDKSPSPPPPLHPPPAAHHHSNNQKVPDPKYSPPHHYGGEHDDEYDRGYRHTIAKGVAIFLVLLGLIALIVYLIYRPEHPQFTVSNAAIYGINATALPLLSASFLFTILFRNPNKRVSIHYQHFTAYVTYHDQPITPITRLPSLHQKTRSLASATPVLGGPGGGSNAVPVSAELLNGLEADEAFGVLGLRVVVVGRMRWKDGAIKTSWKWITAHCDLMVGYRGGSPGQVPLLATPRCHVHL